ncbi:MAG: hypothetical protein R2827_14450 [Bdellovibrionales bacterium]
MAFADRGGNGGGFKELEFISAAYDVVDRLNELGAQQNVLSPYVVSDFAIEIYQSPL